MIGIETEPKTNIKTRIRKKIRIEREIEMESARKTKKERKTEKGRKIKKRTKIGRKREIKIKIKSAIVTLCVADPEVKVKNDEKKVDPGVGKGGEEAVLGIVGEAGDSVDLGREV